MNLNVGIPEAFDTGGASSRIYLAFPAIFSFFALSQQFLLAAFTHNDHAKKCLPLSLRRTRGVLRCRLERRIGPHFITLTENRDVEQEML